MEEKTLYIVVPCYNEQDSIVRVIDNLKKCAPQVDYLIVNDCSTDNTEKTIAFYKSFGFRNLSDIGCCGFMKNGKM